jgi:hypothetical protein
VVRSGDTEFLTTIINEVRKGDLVILECGSGLSTKLVAATLAATNQGKMYSLEHMPSWVSRVSRRLSKRERRRVRVLEAKLIDYTEFSWYSTSSLPPNIIFDLVICDGPPEKTKGGRYGLLPLMHDRLTPEVLILLDDLVTHRSEYKIIQRWEREFGYSCEVRGEYGILTKTNLVGCR